MNFKIQPTSIKKTRKVLGNVDMAMVRLRGCTYKEGCECLFAGAVLVQRDACTRGGDVLVEDGHLVGKTNTCCNKYKAMCAILGEQHKRETDVLVQGGDLVLGGRRVCFALHSVPAQRGGGG